MASAKTENKMALASVQNYGGGCSGTGGMHETLRRGIERHFETEMARAMGSWGAAKGRALGEEQGREEESEHAEELGEKEVKPWVRAEGMEGQGGGVGRETGPEVAAQGDFMGEHVTENKEGMSLEKPEISVIGDALPPGSKKAFKTLHSSNDEDGPGNQAGECRSGECKRMSVLRLPIGKKSIPSSLPRDGKQKDSTKPLLKRPRRTCLSQSTMYELVSMFNRLTTCDDEMLGSSLGSLKLSKDAHEVRKRRKLGDSSGVISGQRSHPGHAKGCLSGGEGQVYSDAAVSLSASLERVQDSPASDQNFDTGGVVSGGRTEIMEDDDELSFLVKKCGIDDSDREPAFMPYIT